MSVPSKAEASADPNILIGHRLKVHFNLHTHLWSVTAQAGPDKGRVIANVPAIELADVIFKVSEAGRARSHRLGHRTVHAWVLGTVTALPEAVVLDGLTQVTYNPAPERPATFTGPDGVPVRQAARVLFACAPDNPARGYAWV
ncbi:hypothetical protein [Nonomuraea sp. NPDC049695]|uniref:hypothetical protein n=1 Tax=Nonomuraea sp. NPDC049695 TaxID=3154734 RepID=UPI00343CD5F1